MGCASKKILEFEKALPLNLEGFVPEEQRETIRPGCVGNECPVRNEIISATKIKTGGVNFRSVQPHYRIFVPNHQGTQHSLFQPGQFLMRRLYLLIINLFYIPIAGQEAIELELDIDHLGKANPYGISGLSSF